MSLDVKSKQILLIGYHGQRNFGDDLFASSILGLLPHCELWSYADPFSDLYFNFSIKSLISTTRTLLPNRFRISSFEKRVKYVVWGGGDLFGSVDYISSTIKTRHFRNDKTIYVGLGLGLTQPKDDRHRQVLATLLKRFHSLTFRDSQSCQIAADLGISNPVNGGDLAYLNQPTYIRISSRSRPIFGLSLCAPSQISKYTHITKDKAAALHLEIVKAFIELCAESDVTPRLLALCTNETQNDLSAFIRSLSLLQIDRSTIQVESYDGNIYHTCSAIATCSKVISMRLHGTIYAAICNVPVGIISYHPKCERFLVEAGALPSSKCLIGLPPSKPIKTLLQQALDYPLVTDISIAQRKAKLHASALLAAKLLN